MNIADIIIYNGTDSSFKERTFIIYPDEKEEKHFVSYEEYYHKSLIYGNMLRRIKNEQGISDSERFHVGVFMQNIPEFLFIFGGCAFTNSTLVGINNAQVGEKLASDINNLDVKVLFVDDADQPHTGGTFLDSVMKTRDIFGFTRLTDNDIIISKHRSTNTYQIADVNEKLQEYSSSLGGFQPSQLDTSNAGMIIFTSGTTGAPKGIEVRWEKLYTIGVNVTKVLNYTKDDIGYVCMPVNHGNSIYFNVMPSMINGAKIFLRRRFSVKNFVKDLEESGATIWNCVGDPVQYVINYIYSNIGQNADFTHLPLRTVVSTGTNFTNRTIFTKMFGLDIFKEVYGSVEAGSFTDVDANSPAYSVGKLLNDVRIFKEGTTKECALAELDKDGRIINLDESAGEIVVSQRSLSGAAFTGYYRLPDETTKKICAVNGEDFYRMGDLGAIVEKQGTKYLVFLGRLGDWIRYKSENWASSDGENVVMKYKGVLNAGFIGVPQSTGKEDDPMVILEVKHQKRFDVDAFYAYCKEKLPHYMLPRFIRLVEKMPMTDTMKLKKATLKHEFYYRNPNLDSAGIDIIYEIRNGEAHIFTTANYNKEITKYSDPTNRDTLRAYTGRLDLF